VALVGLVAGLYIVLGVLLLVIPGIYFATVLFVAVPCAVVEHCGVFEAMRRSRELTEGYRGQILWLLIMLFLLGVAVGMLVNVFTGGKFTLMAIGVEFLTDCWVAVIWATAGSIAYFRLRQIKEGLDFEELSSVFD
jgi:membrane-anchored glycerophosphoryl diester phosphodiesterase (GDPDase)